MNEDIRKFLASLPLDVEKDPIIIKTMPEKYTLAAPESYWAATPKIRSMTVNG